MVAYPQFNGEAKVMNQTILQGLKMHLTHAKASWMDDLYNILWAYWMTPHTPTKKTPFKLMFDNETMIPLDIEIPTLWAEHYNQ